MFKHMFHFKQNKNSKTHNFILELGALEFLQAYVLLKY